MSTFILCACAWEREYMHVCETKISSLFVPCLLAVWNCDKLPVSGCNPRSHVHCISHTGCLLYELHYLDLKSCCLWSVLSAFTCGWVVSLVTTYLPIGSWSGLVWIRIICGLANLFWELSEEDPSCTGDTVFEFRLVSCERCRHSRWQCQDVPQHQRPPLCFTLAGVSVNHLVHGVYILWSCCRMLFFPFWYFHLPFVVIHRAQKYSSYSFLFDIADHDNAASESKLTLTLVIGGMSALFYCRVSTTVSPEDNAQETHCRKSCLW